MSFPFGYVPVHQQQHEHSGVLSPPSTSLYPSHVDATTWLHMQSSNSNSHLAAQSTLDGADLNAANVMQNLRHGDNYPAGPSSWGALTDVMNPVSDMTGMTGANGGMLSGLPFSTAALYPGAQHSHHTQVNNGNLSRQAHPSHADNARDPWEHMTPDQALQANHRIREQSYGNQGVYVPNFSQWRGPSSTAPTTSHTYNRVNGPMFGSDPTFTNGRFSSSQAQHDQDEKSGNLLNVPLADVAARAGSITQPQNGYPVTQSHSSAAGVRGYGEQLVSQQPSGSAWGNMSTRPVESSERPRKRARSQSQLHENNDHVKEEPDSEDDMADDNRTTSKRRKSNQFARGETSNSPMGGDDDSATRRRNARKKENLSDQQKRFNHIQSEKKRRELINKGYYDLNNLVPSLAVGKSGLSRSECLAEVNLYLNTLKQGTAQLLKRLQMPADALDGIKAPPAPAGPPGS